MRNFIARGDVLLFPNNTGAIIAAGAAVLAGALFGVSANTIAVGEEGPLNLDGVYELPKAPSQAWAFGARVYWNDVDKVTTTTAGGNTLIGVAAAPVAGSASEILGRVRLNGSF